MRSTGASLLALAGMVLIVLPLITLDSWAALAIVPLVALGVRLLLLSAFFEDIRRPLVLRGRELDSDIDAAEGEPRRVERWHARLWRRLAETRRYAARNRRTGRGA
jgi:hypothetical protein